MVSSGILTVGNSCESIPNELWNLATDSNSLFIFDNYMFSIKSGRYFSKLVKNNNV